MAVLKENIFIESLLGCLNSRFVIRRCKGQLIVAKKPVRKAPLSESQKRHTSRFKDAVVYAKTALADEEIRRGYQKRAEESGRILSAYNMAIADYMHGPVIGEIDLAGYRGCLADVIRIEATDNFGVAGVMVEILRDDGSLLEVGMAESVKGYPEGWVYYAQSMVASTRGYQVNVRVTDLPGNVTEKTVELWV